jgi:hypothetical protein
LNAFDFKTAKEKEKEIDIEKHDTANIKLW